MSQAILTPCSETVLVTGASGFIAGHIIKLLLLEGFNVKGTVRSLKNKEKYNYLFNLVKNGNKLLTLVEATLENENCWDNIIKGCTYIIHTANPMVTIGKPLTSEQMINPAVNGMKYIINSAIKHKNSIKKVIYTGSLAANGYLPKKGSNVVYCSEKTWTDVKDPRAVDYAISKTLAEKLGWEMCKKHNIPFTSLNPSYTLGPLLNKRKPPISFIVEFYLSGLLPRVPKIGYELVDVREVAKAHLNCIKYANLTNNKRYIISHSNMIWTKDIVKILLDYYGNNKYSISQIDSNILLTKFMGLFIKEIKLYTLPFWNKYKIYDNRLSIKELGIIYRPINETIIDTANSLISYGFIKPKRIITPQNIFSFCKYFWWIILLIIAFYVYWKLF